MTAGLRSACVAAALAIGGPAQADEPPPRRVPTPIATLGAVPVVAPAGLRLTEATEVRVWSPDPKKLLEAIGAHRAQVDGSAVVLRPKAPARPAPEKPAPRYRAATFSIDYDEPDVAKRLSALKAQYGDRPQPAQVQTFVAQLIEPSQQALMNVASVAARQAQGDCTEYAVVLTALLRATGYPARMVIGTLVADKGGRIMGGQHAWSEYWRDGQWIPIDASPLAVAPDADILLVPAGRFSEEGPSWKMSIYGVMQILPTRVELKGPPAIPSKGG